MGLLLCQEVLCSISIPYNKVLNSMSLPPPKCEKMERIREFPEPTPEQVQSWDLNPGLPVSKALALSIIASSSILFVCLRGKYQLETYSLLPSFYL